MTLVFEFADNEGMLLVDLKDLRTTLEYLGDSGKELGTGFGVSKASVNAILRRLLMLEREGGDAFFGEPALQLQDFMQTSRDGRGMINILAADQLIMSPRVYSTFLLWLLSELFENLPELGDPEQPVLVFFFDEAHLLFNDAPEVPAGKNRTGGAPDPLQGRRRLLHLPEPGRHARHSAGPARQPGAARAARLHPERTEGSKSRRPVVSRQPRPGHRPRPSRNWAWAKPSFRCCRTRASPPRCSGY